MYRDTGLPISAIWAAVSQARLSWRAVIGLIGSFREQPPLSACRVVPSAQQLEQMRRKHRVADPCSLCPVRSGSPCACCRCRIPSARPPRTHESSPIGHARCRLVLEPRRIERRATSSGLRTTGSLHGTWINWCMVDNLSARKRDVEKEPQCRDTLVEGRNTGAARRQMKLIAAYVFEAGGIGRQSRKAAKCLTLCT